ncbi:uncharacterized protein LOC126967490 [Leptidea sinapis]|uniref:uncharacterized protein LOC126967490 n=1 Tax=Leptidea sinapis TaxID=189913 RepID=UPI0021C4AE2D|nr:uncharacterized protein LOC126967490 [Leptidea sinapis]
MESRIKSGNVIWETPENLQPVHGLFVKPSSDGTTGDLFVAATEDSGIKSQWLSEQPINFLSAAAQTLPNTAPVFTGSISSLSSPQEESVTTQKRAVLTSPTVKYTYNLPIATEEDDLVKNPIVTSSLSPSTAEETEGSCAASPAVQQYSPYHYIYPHMLSTIVNTLNAYKEPGKTDDNKVATVQTPFWPQAYAYPFQYVVVDPSTWTTSSTTATSSSASGKESS